MEHYETAFMIGIALGTGIFIGAVFMMFWTANYAQGKYKEGYKQGLRDSADTYLR